VSAGPSSSAAILNQGAVTLFGGDINNDERQGGRFTAGYWITCDQSLGIEGSYFFLGSNSVGFAAGGTGAAGEPAIGRPFFNAITGQEDAELVNFPGVVAGSTAVNLSSRLQVAELNAVSLVCCCPCMWKVEALAGFRFLDLNEGLGITEDLAVVPTFPVLGGTQFKIFDQFDTRNQFYGGQVGIRGEYVLGSWFARGSFKLALGDTHETADVNGATTILSPGGGTTVGSGGLLALPSNIGHYSRDIFAVIPEIGLSIGYQFATHVRVSVGYDFLYWSEVARPGDQIDRSINPSQLVRSAGGTASTAAVLHVSGDRFLHAGDLVWIGDPVLGRRGA
jgi:hypothetical protein